MQFHCKDICTIAHSFVNAIHFKLTLQQQKCSIYTTQVFASIVYLCRYLQIHYNMNQLTFRFSPNQNKGMRHDKTAVKKREKVLYDIVSAADAPSLRKRLSCDI